MATHQRPIFGVRTSEARGDDFLTGIDRLLESLDQCAFAVHPNGSLIMANERMTSAMRWQNSHLMGTHWTTYLSVDSESSALHLDMDALSMGIPKPYTFLTPEGTGRTFQIRFSQISINHDEIILAVCRDPASENSILSFVQRRFEIEHLVCTLSGEFLKIHSENIEDVIVSGLGQIGSFVKADHVFLIFYQENGKSVEKVFEWSSTGVYSRKGRISGISLSVIQDTKSEIIPEGRFRTSSSIIYPPIAQHEREYLKTLGIQAILSLPLIVKGEPIGCFGIDSCEEDRTWFDEDLGLLRLTAELFANALLRYRSERKLQTADARYRALAQNFPNGMVFLFDREEKLFLAEGEDLCHFQLSKKHIEGRTLDEIFPEKAAGALRANLRETFVGKDFSTEIECNRQWYEIRGVPIHNSRDEINFCMIVAQRITERKQIEQELREARFKEEHTAIQIQKTLLISEIPKGIRDVEFGFLSLPSLFVDGDFAEFLVLDDHTIDIVVGDVMGKGIPAALIAAATKEAFLRNVTRLTGQGHGSLPSVKQIMEALQQDIGPRLDQLSVFVTMVYFRLDLRNKTITLINAGHPPMLHLQSEPRELLAYTSNSMPLGLICDIPTTQQIIPFSWNDRLLVFSDGITESRDLHGKPFGEERLRNLYRQTAHLHAQAVAEQILHEAQAFSQTTHLQDDFTCLVVDLHGAFRR